MSEPTCPNGHPLTPANVVTYPSDAAGGRKTPRCRLCLALAKQRRYQTHRAQILARNNAYRLDHQDALNAKQREAARERARINRAIDADQEGRWQIEARKP